jgi:hypothetical protein
MPSSFVKWTKDNTTLVPAVTAPEWTFPAGRTGHEWEGAQNAFLEPLFR